MREQVFSHQYFYDKERQRALMDRLRNPKRPSVSELIEKMPLLETILFQYPTWIPIIVDIKSIQQWRDWSNEIPDFENRITATKNAGSDEEPNEDNIVSLLFRIVMACCAFWFLFGKYLPFG
ncbi:MAG: hypothetical protein V4447_03425 [Pseudomonadota bacterium]